jgi:DNA-binding response OmpR family regulator
LAKMAVLLIEDNTDLSVNIRDFLEPRGHSVGAAGDGVSGLRLATTRDFDVIVLDLGLPQMDGLEICQKLRTEVGKTTPILVLTARDSLEDKLLAFDSGADDYLTKPFALEELQARLLALVKRSTPDETTRILQVADLSLNLDTLEAVRGRQRIKLTPMELKILEILMRQSRRIVPRRELERALWGHGPPDSNALRAHIHSLRAAIDKPFALPLLHTVHSVGYRLSEPDDN